MADGALVFDGLQVTVGDTVLLDDVSFSAPEGRVTVVMGPSGAGKSTLGRATCGALVGAHIAAGSIDLPHLGLRADRSAPAALAGRGVAWVPQDAGAGLSPFARVGVQLDRALRDGGRQGGPDAGDALLVAAALREPDRVRAAFPHELSGGMRRRAGLALALACAPAFLVVDEPGAGLDPRVAAAVHHTLGSLAAGGTGILLLTHDRLAAHRLADQIVVMDDGRVLEAAGSAAALTSETGRALFGLGPPA